ncbi:MAG: hypothetical protein CMH57_08125 [Myxococcales bacterium]|nr:hypothetical protein [Myxococcales bacterium]
MSETFIFEPPQPSDRETIATLLAQDMKDLGVSRTAEELLELSDLVLEDGGATCFCRVARPGPGEQAVGIVLASITFSVKYAGRALWIENLFVSHDWRRRRIGRLLVEELLDWAEFNGIKGIDLEAYQGNTPAALLYRSIGFERLNRERFWFSFEWIDGV